MAYAPVYRVQLVRERSIRYTARDPAAATRILREVCIADRGDRETMAVIYLDGRSRVIGCEVVAIGGGSGLSVAAREIFRGALLASASAIVLGHNHPSGDPKPSKEDSAMTIAVRRAGDAIGIALLDHIVVTRDESFSYLENGLL